MNLWVRNLGGTWRQFLWLLMPIGVIHSADFNGGRAGLESLKSLHSHSVHLLSGTSALHYLASLSLSLSLSLHEAWASSKYGGFRVDGLLYRSWHPGGEKMGRSCRSLKVQP